MKYIPTKSTAAKDRVSVSFHDNTFLKMVSELDPAKISDKYKDFHNSSSIDFVDEDGYEYHVLIGTRTSLIRQAIVRAWTDGTPDDNSVRYRTEDFVRWLRAQGTIRYKEGD
jgi:hypothetical protein